MTPVDRVGIFSTSGQFTPDFTSDKEALKRKLIGLMPQGALDKHTHDCPDVSYWMADQFLSKAECSTGLTVKSGFELKPGKYLNRQVVRDSEGAQTAARNGIVVIPD